MRDNLCRISDAKQGCDLTMQIRNDFVCLLVLHVKSIVYKQKNVPYKMLREEMREVLLQPDVKEALRLYQMPKLTLAEKLFLFFMKHHMYLPIWMAVRLVFR